jgi:hypothetical protein
MNEAFQDINNVIYRTIRNGSWPVRIAYLVLSLHLDPSVCPKASAPIPFHTRLSQL